MTVWSQEHIDRVKAKAECADSLGEFWRAMMVSACEQLSKQKRTTDRYGVALMMIREGCADPKELAGRTVAEASGNWPAEVFKPLPEAEAKLLRDYGVSD